MRWIVGLVLLCVFAACATSPEEAERIRVRAHLEAAYAEVAAHSVGDLSPTQRDARERVLADLRAYIDAEVYPTNLASAERTPIFVDPFGVRCAMAAVIEASGGGALVERIARDHLYAHIADLDQDAELARWLEDHGLTLAEAARIQPGYDNTTGSSWTWTAAAVATAQLGAQIDDDTSGEGWLLAGVRAGARRITRTPEGSACDHCVYRSSAIVGEYQRRLAPGSGSNVVGLALHYELDEQGRDHQIYVLGGGTLALGDGAWLGGKLGLGWSLRNRSAPGFVELALVGQDQEAGFSAHAGLAVGAVW